MRQPTTRPLPIDAVRCRCLDEVDVGWNAGGMELLVLGELGSGFPTFGPLGALVSWGRQGFHTLRLLPPDAANPTGDGGAG